MCHLTNNLFRFSSKIASVGISHKWPLQLFVFLVITFGWFDDITLWFIDWQPRLYVYTAISRKVFGKSACNNAKRYCVWFWVLCSSKKFVRMTVEAIDICLHVLKESNKVGSKATVSGTGYWSYPTLSFGMWWAHFFPTTILEIAVLYL